MNKYNNQSGIQSGGSIRRNYSDLQNHPPVSKKIDYKKHAYNAYKVFETGGRVLGAVGTIYTAYNVYNEGWADGLRGRPGPQGLQGVQGVMGVR